MKKVRLFSERGLGFRLEWATAPNLGSIQKQLVFNKNGQLFPRFSSKLGKIRRNAKNRTEHVGS